MEPVDQSVYRNGLWPSGRWHGSINGVVQTDRSTGSIYGTYPFEVFHTSLGSTLYTKFEVKSDLTVTSAPSSERRPSLTNRATLPSQELFSKRRYVVQILSTHINNRYIFFLLANWLYAHLKPLVQEEENHH